jgi:hypothetical protein
MRCNAERYALQVAAKRREELKSMPKTIEHIHLPNVPASRRAPHEAA